MRAELLSQSHNEMDEEAPDEPEGEDVPNNETGKSTELRHKDLDEHQKETMEVAMIKQL